jgi:T5SS/PEP-CTERM-associated repeat protein
LHAEDNTSTQITSLVNHGGANYIVGDTGTNNSLVISTGGILTNVASGYIGNAASASNNWAMITDSGSAWHNSNRFIIGLSGGYNTLTISNGARVFNLVCFIGSNTTANGNLVLVSDSNSVWTTSGGLYVGLFGSGNQLTITNGGRVTSFGCTVGSADGANNNAVTITGTGSVWTNAGDLYIGNSGAGNQLTIINSGQVVNTYGYVGSAPSASNNMVTVSGSGSVWNNSNILFVGTSGSGNKLMITNGGRVVSASGYVSNSSSVSNMVTVTGPGSIWTNSSGLYMGDYGDGNSLIIINGGQFRGLRWQSV